MCEHGTFVIYRQIQLKAESNLLSAIDARLYEANNYSVMVSY